MAILWLFYFASQPFEFVWFIAVGPDNRQDFGEIGCRKGARNGFPPKEVSMKPEDINGQTEFELANALREGPVRHEPGNGQHDSTTEFDRGFEALLRAYAEDPERWDGLE
jgi:hypothetical protein